MSTRIKYHPLAEQLHYDVRITISEATGRQAMTAEIGYEMSVQPAAKQGWSGYCLRLDRTPARYLLHTPNPAEEVIQRLAAPMLQLEVMLSDKGIPTQVRNHGAIWQHWREEVRPAIASGYTGALVDDLIYKTDAVLLHHDTLLETVSVKDWILQHYFSGPYNRSFNPFTRNTLDTHVLFQALGNTALPLQEQWHQVTNDPPFQFEISSFLMKEYDSASASDHIERKTGATRPFALQVQKNGFYNLHPDNGWCRDFLFSYDIHAASVYHKNITLKLTPSKNARYE